MLTLIVFIPLVASLILLFFNKEDTRAIRNISVGAAGLSLLISFALLFRFDSVEPGMQFTETLAWVPMFNINYQVGVDGISFWLVVLFLMPFICSLGLRSLLKYVKYYTNLVEILGHQIH